MQTLAEIFENELTLISRNFDGFANRTDLVDVLFTILSNSEDVEYNGVGPEGDRDYEASFVLKDGSELFVGNIRQLYHPVFFFTHGND